MTVLGVVPARGGSKGLPGKNIAPLGGRPLIAYTADAVRGSARLSRTVLSTDDERIRDAGRRAGLDAPFLRPAELATDTATSAAVALHALAWAEHDGAARYDAVALLEPTAPLRLSMDIDAAIAMLEASDADAVVAVYRVDAPHPVKMQVIDAEGVLRPFLPAMYRDGLRRQDLPAVYALSGAIYAVRSEALRGSGSLWGRRSLPYVMPVERSVNIDSPFDLQVAEVLLARQPIPEHDA